MLSTISYNNNNKNNNNNNNNNNNVRQSSSQSDVGTIAQYVMEGEERKWEKCWKGINLIIPEMFLCNLQEL